MENIIKLNASEGFTRYSEIRGIYYTSLLSEDGSPLARIIMIDSEDVFETTHAIAKEIDLIAFPDRKPAPTTEEA